MNNWFKLTALSLLLFGCNAKKEPVLFELLTSEKTGITFNNEITPSNDLNIFRYMYFYNGAGIGAGDFNNDGLIDVFFSANQGQNELYINKGKLTFENISQKAGIIKNGGWSTGVSVVDINQDGLLDIYVSQVGDFEVLHAKNLLFICEKIDADGIPIFSEQAKEYGLDLVGFGTQAAFFDYDLDGDLDFFQLNHSVHQNGTFGRRDNFINTKHPLAGDRIFENIDGSFIEKSDQSGINQNALGYGLGLAISDIDLDGYPDIYVGNDFHENDYLYINQKNGQFKDELSQRLSHTSRFSMGVDIADLNHDIFPEIVSLDMLPFEHEILKRSEGEDTFYNFEFKLKQGYDYQFARNNLQLNNGKGVFSEIGMYSNISATDWSWSSLFDDFDNDGETDLFISNGIAKRMNDTDYINIVSNDEIQKRIQEKTFDESDEALTDLIPEIKIPNKVFLNKGKLTFLDAKSQIQNDKDSFSNGAVSVDLDNDGDLDLITNNINAPAFIYENKSDTTSKHIIKIGLKGNEKNLNGIGSKVIAFAKNEKYYKEKFPVRGFQSSSEAPFIFATKNPIDSLWIIWPDNSFQSIPKTSDKSIILSYQKGLPLFDYEKLRIPEKGSFVDVSNQILPKPLYHKENTFNEFDREALIPNKMSTEGPAVAVGDLNDDGLDDLYFGGARKEKSKVLFQTKTGTLEEFVFPDITSDSAYEDVDALIIDVNNDGLNDIIALSGGNEYLNKSEFNTPRLYLNNGSNGFIKSKEAFPLLFTTSQCVRDIDFDGDGDLDLFIGSRTFPWAYGKIPPSYLMINDGKGNFTIKKTPELEHLGMVKDAQWIDIDQDNDPDLIVALEWDGIYCLENNNGQLIKKTLTDKKGWWNIIYPTDINSDGKIDFIIGNLGENSRLKASEKKPVRMYVNDMDDNGRLDQILTYYLENEEVIFADKKELEKQMPFIRKKFNLAKDFAKADFRDVLGRDKIKESRFFEANYFKTAILLNKGNGAFEIEELPWQTQLGPISAISEIKGSSEYLLAGNFFDSNIQLGRYDGGIGGILDKEGKYHNIPGITLRGQIRQILPIKINGESHYLIIGNNAAIRIIKKVNS
ncbi:VCBS repeat-containing protein [Arcticibacterium luteifluviistationis]|uniref:ASPIC/UnbV domain-containing protein n=1 Tax=Arcticibacterium luteifluviistationis TaxID=1784714 RepID=A0A2Z4GG27_9BACT|nr:VCBS repeat-containing protein [Arcticibacterium luteifluviistationis]AWV99944.1 hypothetical protein DJ013_17920 [Arcticibacterium luteifluviistationis]